MKKSPAIAPWRTSLKIFASIMASLIFATISYADGSADQFAGSFKLIDGNCSLSGRRIAVKVEKPQTGTGSFLSVIDGANDDGPLLNLPLSQSTIKENSIQFHLQERAQRVITLQRESSGLTITEQSDHFRCSMSFEVDNSFARLR